MLVKCIEFGELSPIKKSYYPSDFILIPSHTFDLQVKQGKKVQIYVFSYMPISKKMFKFSFNSDT